MLEDVSIINWIIKHDIRTEKGAKYDLKSHYFLIDILRDLSPLQVCIKAAQLGLTVAEFLKLMFVVKKKNLDVIYTLPTDNDVQVMVGGKFNRIIANNPVLQSYTNDKDTVEQKKIGDGMAYFRGTFTKKAAISVTSDLNVHDEVDFSNMNVINDYESRLQHSKFKGQWMFGHPSTDNYGVDIYWKKSDQKHWFIKCPHCKKEHYMEWPKSVYYREEQGAIKEAKYVCKYCQGELSDDDRRIGRWVKKYKDREWSGYWIPLFIAPWVTAKTIVDYYLTKDEEYFFNRVLGLPYVGSGNKLTKTAFMQNLDDSVNDQSGRIVIGMDTGKKLHYVAGNEQGLFYYSEATDYQEIEDLMDKWPRAILVVDQGGDLIHPREMLEKYPGRVFLCTYGEDRKTKELIRWGKNDEMGSVLADRNRIIDMLVGEFRAKKIPVFGTENDWYDAWLHWNNLTRIVEETERGFIRKNWKRAGDDHWAHAMVYWRIGMDRFGTGLGKILADDDTFVDTGVELPLHGGMNAGDVKKLMPKKDTDDWRKLA